MKIANSLDWNPVLIVLETQAKKLYGANAIMAMKILANICGSVHTLSRFEVDARRTHKTRLVEEQLEKVNNEIHEFEQLLFLAQIAN